MLARLLARSALRSSLGAQQTLAACTTQALASRIGGIDAESPTQSWFSTLTSPSVSEPPFNGSPSISNIRSEKSPAAEGLQASGVVEGSSGSPVSTSGGVTGASAADPTWSPSVPGLIMPGWASEMVEDLSDLTPKQVVERLDRNIVGQTDAKKAVANALRNRWRRHKIPSPMKEEIIPRNILMIGPTGCGKTEIARRLAKLMDAPFVKVEATKFTEVGFHGRDVDQIIRDLVDNAILLVKAKLRRAQASAIAVAVEERILDAIVGSGPGSQQQTRENFRALYRQRLLEDRLVKIKVPATVGQGSFNNNMEPNMGFQAAQDLMQTMKTVMGQRARGQEREIKISEARSILEDVETERLVSEETVVKEAVHSVEQDGIVFIDEIDKIVSSSENRFGGADASSEGVQRDLLPIIEGSVVSTKHGNVTTDHILFICSGSFHSVKPSDMLAELQGRLPVRVELKGLTQHDFERILTEPEFNMLRQQQALLKTEGIELEFDSDAVSEIARLAEEINHSVDNIGARRLHTVLERILEEISFEAPEEAMKAKADDSSSSDSHKYVVTKDYVGKRLGDLVKRQDLSKFVL